MTEHKQHLQLNTDITNTSSTSSTGALSTSASPSYCTLEHYPTTQAISETSALSQAVAFTTFAFAHSPNPLLTTYATPAVTHPEAAIMSIKTLEHSRTKTDTGLSNSTHSSHSSSLSAERYDLDENDSRPMLVYQYGQGVRTSSQKDICAWLDKENPTTPLRVTKKAIPSYTSYVHVERNDLFLPEEHDLYRRMPNYHSSLASIKVPYSAYFSRILLGNYDNLYIVSPESSPRTSTETSPTNTWAKNSLTEDEDTVAGS